MRLISRVSEILLELLHIIHIFQLPYLWIGCISFVLRPISALLIPLIHTCCEITQNFYHYLIINMQQLKNYFTHMHLA